MKPLLLLHGALGSENQFQFLKGALSSEGFSPLTLNFTGHGGKALDGEFGIEQFGADVIEFLKISRIQSVDIFGYSMGGYVATWLAWRYPDIIDRVMTLGTKFDWSPETASKEVRKLDPDKILEKVPAFAAILRKRHHPSDWKRLLNKTSDMMLSLGDLPLLNEEKLSEINQTILVALGDADDMADRAYSEKVAEIIPNGKFLLLDNTPHAIEKVNVATIVSLLRAFLGR